MSLFTLALIAGILVGLMALLVIFSLLTMAQQSDAYLEINARKGNSGRQVEHQPAREAEVRDGPRPEVPYSRAATGSMKLS